VEINKNSVNKIAVTFSEKATYSNSEWLIKFTNDVNGANGSRVIAVDDISLFKTRSNIFYITESNTEDLPNAIVKLDPPGSWTYIAYEMAPSSPRNMDIEDAIGIVEEGICDVVDLSKPEVITFKTDNEKNNYTFKG